MSPNVAVALRYFEACESFASGPALAAFFDPEVVQRELPNRLVPSGAVRDLAALQAGAESGRRVMSAQRFEVKNIVENGDQIAAELEWTGTLAVPLGKTPAGGQMRAAFGVFLTFKGGRIVSQRNYDCFYEF